METLLDEKPRPVSCILCSGTDHLRQLECGHSYCVDCLLRCLESHVRHCWMIDLTCCSKRVDLGVLQGIANPDHLRRVAEARSRSVHMPVSKTQCHVGACSDHIPFLLSSLLVHTCPKCGTVPHIRDIPKHFWRPCESIQYAEANPTRWSWKDPRERAAESSDSVQVCERSTSTPLLAVA